MITCPQLRHGLFRQVLASIAALGALVATSAAAAPALSVPGRLYPTPDVLMPFAGTDPVSGDDRGIHVSGLDVNPARCRFVAGITYDTFGCALVLLNLNTRQAGLLRVPGAKTPADTTGDGVADSLVTSSGLVIQTVDSQGRDGDLFYLRGTQAQIQAALDTLEFVPCRQQQGTAVANPAPGGSPVEVDCGQPGGNPASEPVYEERESLDTVLPSLFVQAVAWGGGLFPTKSASVVIKVEGTNPPPSLVAPPAPVNVQNGATTAISAQQFSVTDDMCNLTLCGGPYTEDPGRAEADDAGLLVAWLPAANCGTFSLLGVSGFPFRGGPAVPGIRQLLRLRTGLSLNNPFQSATADSIAAQVESTLPPEAVALNLATQTGNGANTTVFAGIGPILELRYALAVLTYNAPATDKVCQLRLAMSDLGNNGAPVAYHGSPFGPEAPYPADPGGNTVPWELPNALASTRTVAFVVGTGGPDSDGDGVPDGADNCTALPNGQVLPGSGFGSQCDSDGDGYGNRCDADLNNNAFTNAQDVTLFRQQLGQPSPGPTYNEADLNCNGFVNAQDATLFRQLLGSPPGPSAFH